MSAELATNEVRQSSSLVSDDVCRVEFIEIVPLSRDTDDQCTTECDSAHWTAAVKQEILPVVNHKQPDDVPESLFNMKVEDNTNDTGAECDQVDKTQSHVQPVVVPETLNLACISRKYTLHAGGRCMIMKTEAERNDVTERAHDDQPKLHLCTVCHKQFRRKGHLNAHSYRHTGVKLFPCTQCEKRFSCQMSLHEHMNIHTTKYRCTECGRCCRTSSALTVHRRVHSGEKPFECTVCNKRFRTSHDLVIHSRIHSGEKPYNCHLCEKVFSVSSALHVHMRVHTGDKPYVCSVCGKRFTRSGDLGTHSRTHSGEKLYKCYVCEKAFVVSSHLYRHLRVHTGKKLQ